MFPNQNIYQIDVNSLPGHCAASTPRRVGHVVPRSSFLFGFDQPKPCSPSSHSSAFHSIQSERSNIPNVKAPSTSYFNPSEDDELYGFHNPIQATPPSTNSVSIHKQQQQQPQQQQLSLYSPNQLAQQWFHYTVGSPLVRNLIPTEIQSIGEVLDLRIEGKKREEKNQSLDSHRLTPESRITDSENTSNPILDTSNRGVLNLQQAHVEWTHEHTSLDDSAYQRNLNSWLVDLQRYQYWQQKRIQYIKHLSQLSCQGVPFANSIHSVMEPLKVNQAFNQASNCCAETDSRCTNDMGPLTVNEESRTSETNDTIDENVDGASHLSGKCPVICYYPEPLDSLVRIRAMLDRRDTRLKYVNDGAAIRNPFAVDRKIQLAHLTATLCTRTKNGAYLCKACNRSTLRLRQMEQHLLAHSASKFNLCVKCLKGFNDKYDMKRHTRKHTLIRPYVCPECSRPFSQRCSLEGHRRKIHQVHLTYSRNQRREVVRVCEVCGFACRTVTEMFQHTVQKHENSSSLARLYRQLQRQTDYRRRQGEKFPSVRANSNHS